MDDDQDDLFTPGTKPKRRTRKRRVKPERNLWREDEILVMLDIFKDYKALELLNDKNNKADEIFQDIEKEMSKMGYRKKNYNQIWTKWKFLKSTYTTSRRSNKFPNYLTLDVYQAIDNIMYKVYGSRSTLQPPNYMMRSGGREDPKPNKVVVQKPVIPASRQRVEPLFAVKEEPTEEEEDQFEDLSFQQIEEEMNNKKKVELKQPIQVRKLPRLMPKPTVKKEPQKKTPILMPTLTISVQPKGKIKPIPIRRLEEPASVQITPIGPRRSQAPPLVQPFPTHSEDEEEHDKTEGEEDREKDEDEISTIRHNEIVNSTTNPLSMMTHEQFSTTMKEMQSELLENFFKKQEELIKEEYNFQRQQDERLLRSFEEQNRCILEATKNILNGLTHSNSIQTHPVEQDSFNHFMYFNGQ